MVTVTGQQPYCKTQQTALSSVVVLEGFADWR